MSTYLIATLNITDRSRYAQYEAGFMDIFNQYGGRLLSVDEAPVALEGDWSFTRTVLIEFPTEQQALDWFNSSEYQTLALHRKAASVGAVALLHALPGT